MWLALKKRGIHRNPKTILRIMEKYGLLAEIRRRRKWQQTGQQVHKYKNLLNGEFYANWPNSKWVTDISYIQTNLKTECVYRHKPVSFCEANKRIDRYINFYNYERIQ